MDWGTQLKRYRRAQGLTQARMAEITNVEQATISRWERGTHEPELGMQRRLRDLIFGRGLSSDGFILKNAANSPFAMKISTQHGKNIVASATAAALHGVLQPVLAEANYRPYFTAELENNWQKAVEMGFFHGEVANVRVCNRWKPLNHGPELACVSYWTPARLSDGEIVMVGEFRLIDLHELALKPSDERFVVQPMDTAVT